MRASGGLLHLLDGPTDPCSINMHLHEAYRARRVSPLRFRTARQQPPQYLICGPTYGGDGRDAEPLVDLGAAGVIDPSHDIVDTKGFAYDASRQDVGVVTTGHRSKAVGVLDTGLEKHLAIKADTPHGLARKVRAEAAEGLGVEVDHRDSVATLLQASGQAGPDPAAAHDHDVHAVESSEPGCGDSVTPVTSGQNWPSR